MKLLARDVGQTVCGYHSLDDATIEERKAGYLKLVDRFYILVTDFYEYGWGQSFHFAPRRKAESLAGSIARYEQFVSQVLKLRPGMRVLDVGCGVGGPMRCIARFSGAHVTGVNVSEYQIGRGRAHNRAQGLEKTCEFLRADFLHLPLRENSCDAAYDFEATCHTPDRGAVYREVFRALKPGASFATATWCLSTRYDPSKADHRCIKKGIEVGNGLPDISSIPDVLNALKTAGFEIVEHRDLTSECSPETPWYLPLAARSSASGIRHTRAGRWLTTNVLRAMETLRIAPRGSTAVSDMLNAAADTLVLGGKTGIFTPLYFIHASKPLQ